MKSSCFHPGYGCGNDTHRPSFQEKNDIARDLDNKIRRRRIRTRRMAFRNSGIDVPTAGPCRTQRRRPRPAFPTPQPGEFTGRPRDAQQKSLGSLNNHDKYPLTMQSIYHLPRQSIQMPA
jgi:hypothetical protein